MAKNSIRDFDNAAGNNTDIQSQNIDEGCSPANINNAIRELMADLADVNDGTISLVSPDFDSATFDGTLIAAFPSGTRMLFQQTSAPVNWTKVTEHNDKALRVVSGTVGTGGTVAFETAFASHTPTGSVSVTVNGHPLTEAQMPKHYHLLVGPHTMTWPQAAGGAYGNYGGGTPDDSAYRGGTWSVGGGAVSGGQSTGTGNGQPHSHGADADFDGTAIDLDVQYVDVIICERD